MTEHHGDTHSDDAPQDDVATRLALPTGPLAALLAGLAAAIVLVGGTLAGLGLCDAVRGTTTCGGAGGLVGMLLIGVAAVAAGALVLARGEVEYPVATSLFALMLVAVVALVFFPGLLLGWIGAVLTALVSVAAYALGYWVTNRLVSSDSPGT